MAINLSGQAIQDVRVAGVQAQRVMLGTGTTAVEVWSAVPPLQGFDYNYTTTINTDPSVWVWLASHTIVGGGSGDFHLNWEYGSTSLFFNNHTTQVRLTLNGVQIGRWEQTRMAQSWVGSGTVSNILLAPGDVIRMEGYATVNNANLRQVRSRRLRLVPHG